MCPPWRSGRPRTHLHDCVVGVDPQRDALYDAEGAQDQREEGRHLEGVVGAKRLKVGHDLVDVDLGRAAAARELAHDAAQRLHQARLPRVDAGGDEAEDLQVGRQLLPVLRAREGGGVWVGGWVDWGRV